MMNEQLPQMQANSDSSSDSELRKPIVELIDISKRFPGVLANDRISLTVWPGEVHCLLGENGAGKSTLMQILSGMYQPDSGTIRINGQEVRIDSPREALDHGMGMVYQHPTLVPVFTVLENLLLGNRKGITLDRQTSIKRFEEYAHKLGIDIDPESVVSSLALGQQQQVEIIKALWKGSSVLILDEPTSMLTPQGIEELKDVIAQLKKSGLAIIFISHKLQETLDMGDRISVLRRGRLVGTIEPRKLRKLEDTEIQSMVIDMMFGEETAIAENVIEVKEKVTGKVVVKAFSEEKPLLELKNVDVADRFNEVGVRDVSFSVRAGEILGIAGVDGNGQRALAEGIAGQRKIVSGDIQVSGHSIVKKEISVRQSMGLRYVTDDRLGEGVCATLSVSRNLLLKRIGQKPFWRWGRTNEDIIRQTAEALTAEYDVRLPSIESKCGGLSGGNIQKVLLARELSYSPKIVIYNKPTHGLDFKTTVMVREKIKSLAREDGVAELLISTDLDEIIDLSDRIAVMCQGRIVGIVENRPGIEKRVGELMIGGSL
jgi:general nucleoside transport system ATP-binding protein